MKYGSWPLLIRKEIIKNKPLKVLSRNLSTFCPHRLSICWNLLSQGDSLRLCWKQVRQDIPCTNMFPTDPWMRSSPICPAGPRRTAASWRALRGSAACCGGSWNAGCWAVRLSTGLPTEFGRPPPHAKCGARIPHLSVVHLSSCTSCCSPSWDCQTCFFKTYFYSFCEYVGLVCNDISVWNSAFNNKCI